jgi:hypothetical protein
MSRNIWWHLVHGITGCFHSTHTGRAPISPRSPPVTIPCESQPYPTECHAAFGRLYYRPNYNYILSLHAFQKFRRSRAYNVYRPSLDRIQLTPLILKSLNLKYRLYWSETKSPISFSHFLCKKVGYFEIAYIEISLILKSTLGPLRW